MKKWLIALISLVFATAVQAQEKFRVAYSHYTGWEPYQYMADHGILKKWADKYGIKIELTLVNDYIESINLYTAGKFDACTMTNMDALTIPAVGGVDSTALIVGDFSNGNDGIVSKVASDIKGLKGKKIKLVELSVSHYLLARELDKAGLSERDVKLINTSDAEIASAFITDQNATVVTWNPPLQQVRMAKGAKLLADSSNIPGEIIDLLVVKSKSSDKFKKAMVGAWYETMAIMNSKTKKGKAAIQFMAKHAGATESEFRAQLKTTAMFYDAKKAAAFARSDDVKKTMDLVRTFSFEKGLFGQNASSKEFVGISFPDGTVMGNKQNVKFRFDAKYMGMAAAGQL